MNKHDADESLSYQFDLRMSSFAFLLQLNSNQEPFSVIVKYPRNKKKGKIKRTQLPGLTIWMHFVIDFTDIMDSGPISEQPNGR